MNQPTRPIVRYHGSKWKLAPWIISHMPAHRIYTEPFGGAASVLLQKPRSYGEVYNDLDGEIVNLFRVLRNATLSGKLKKSLELTPFAREEFDASYEADDDPLEQARRTVMRCFMGFGSDGHTKNTGFRANSNRSGSTPAHDWVNWPSQIERITARLQGVVIENRQALDIIQQHDGKETLHYVDPPYLHSTRHSSKGYKFEMTDEDHRALASVLNRAKGMVLLSGYDSPLYNELYAGWHRFTKAALADGARERNEVLWMNPNAYKQHPEPEMFPL